MTAQQVNKIAAAIANRIPVVIAAPNDSRVESGQLITVEQGRQFIVRKLRRLFGQLERMCDESAFECEGKSEEQIASIMRRRLDAIRYD